MTSISKQWYLPVLLLFAFSALALGCGGGGGDSSSSNNNGSGSETYAPEEVVSGTVIDAVNASNIHMRTNSSGLIVAAGSNGLFGTATMIQDNSPGTMSCNWAYAKTAGTTATLLFTVTATSDPASKYEENAKLNFTLNFESEANGIADIDITDNGSKPDENVDATFTWIESGAL